MWLTLIACSADAPIRSVPTEPTTQLEKQVEEPQIVWSDLADLFDPEPASLPIALKDLAPGMAGKPAIELLDHAHQPAVPITVKPVADHLVASTLMAGREDVGIVLIFDLDGRALQEVQLALPDDEAMPVLSVKWGNASSFTTDAADRPVYRWTREGAAWDASLGTTVEQPYQGLPPKATGILRYVPAGT
ncbi:MAG: hypothetical protein H6735_21450 [Alphaproteobacteria bacterium]|nr:hypothetical protein [Alphaproteobacteria bacterium]